MIHLERVALLASGALGGDVEFRVEFVRRLNLTPAEMEAAHAIARRAMLRGEALPDDGYFGPTTDPGDPVEAVRLLAVMLDGGGRAPQGRRSGPSGVTAV